MLYALRKLIAFMFLGGLFWFIYSDPAEIGNPVFMHTLGILTAAFAAFWLIIPALIVRMRIEKRQKQNVERYQAWKQAMGDKAIQPLLRKVERLSLSADERVYLHEKGTLYVEPRTGFDEIAVKGRPGDVAFPGLRRNSRKIQRTHCYLTDRRIMFVGKALTYSFSYSELKSCVDKPGGLVFAVEKDNRNYALAFTFQNPLIAADYVKQSQMRVDSSK